MALLISIGIMATTSGMGIAAVLGIWGLFLILRDERDGTFHFKNILRKRNLIAAAILVVVFLVAVQYVPILQRAVRRIFVPSKNGTTAISGRTKMALEMIRKMSPIQWLLGVADNTHGTTFTVSGLLDVLYRHGIIGLVLANELYAKCIFKLKLPYKFIGLVIFITAVFSAHTHSTIGMLNFLLILMCGVADRQDQLHGIQAYKVPGK